MECKKTAGDVFDAIIPIPAEIKKHDLSIAVSEIRTFFISAQYPILADELEYLCSYYKLDIAPADDEKSAVLVIRKNSALGRESWRITVSPERILLEGGDKNGVFYAFAALAQMLAAALARGPQTAVLNCGTVFDKPRFEWRSFMLDSARHFQSKDTVKKLIRVMAHLRMNRFHWHLTDDESWRIASEVVPGMGDRFVNDPGQYSFADLKEVADYASCYGIVIVPEIDVPGHSHNILLKNPQLACDPGDIATEYCLGNPAVKEFLQKIFLELMSVFPDSPYIHLGGDEAETAHWEKCPQCQNAMRERGLKNMRELENSFMADMTNFITENGRTPILWGTCSGQVYPSNTVIQAWLDIREPLRVAENGNEVIFSVHNSLYFDYPADNGEPSETWMFALPEQAVYMTDPYIIWEDKVKDVIIGTEACLWTETVPEWRVMQKIMPRIFAYSECAWSMPECKDWYGFLRRREFLTAAGYTDFLRGR